MCVLNPLRSPPGWFDLSGYYWPNPRIVIGRYRLTHIWLGDPEQFAAWRRRPETVAPPIQLIFEDPVSPMTGQDPGGPVLAGRLRVTPDSFALHEGHVSFRAKEAHFGLIEFDGDVNVDGVYGTRVTTSVPGTPRPMMYGRLRIGDQTFERAGFNWYEGYEK